MHRCSSLQTDRNLKKYISCSLKTCQDCKSLSRSSLNNLCFSSEGSSYRHNELLCFKSQNTEMTLKSLCRTQHSSLAAIRASFVSFLCSFTFHPPTFSSYSLFLLKGFYMFLAVEHSGPSLCKSRKIRRSSRDESH